jgi:rhamnogalacturonyl hydrolase YesR
MNRRSFFSAAGAAVATAPFATRVSAATPAPAAGAATAPGEVTFPANLAGRSAVKLSRLSALERFRKRVLATKLETLNTGWEDVLVPQGLALGGLADDDALGKLAERWIAPHLQTKEPGEAGFPAKSLKSGEPFQGVRLDTYCGDWGLPLVLAPLYRLTKREEYRRFAGRICEHILHKSLRLADGGIAHGGTSPVVRERLWVDTLYYTAAPLAATFALDGNPACATEAIRQCIAHAKHLQDPATGLFFHDAVPGTANRSDSFWARGNGWVIMSLLDTLTQVPRETAGWSTVLDSYRRLVTGLLRYQQPSGLWRIVPEDPESHLEVSGTTMILIGLLGGIEADLVQPEMAARVTRGFSELCTWIGRDGALQGAQRPAGLGGWETHKQSTLGECTYATGVFLRLLSMVATSKRLVA